MSTETLKFPKQNTPKSPTPHRLAPDNARTGRVLLVESDPELLRVLETALTENYEVIVAKDGHEALKLWRKFTPDLIVTSVIMPQMDGFILIAELRQRTKAPIIALLQRESQNATRYLLEVGANLTFVTTQVETGLLFAVESQMPREKVYSREGDHLQKAG